jgi:hypothetical protein
MKRLFTALKVACWAFKNPQTLNESNFKMLSDLLKLILDVSDKHRPMTTHIAYVHPEEGEQVIVSIWAGVGIDCSPTKRITELLKENSELKTLLGSQIREEQYNNYKNSYEKAD